MPPRYPRTATPQRRSPERRARTGKVVFSPTGVTLRVGVPTRTLPAGRAKSVDRATSASPIRTTQPSASASAVGFATPTLSLKKTANVLGNYVDAVKAAGFPIGDTVVAQECDSSVVIPTTVGSDCDSATQVSGPAGTSGKVTFSPTGVTLLVGSAYSDSASGTCPFGGTCEVVVSDSGNPGIGLDEAVTFATPTASVRETSNVAPNYVDKVTADEFPAGDTVTAQECDANVTSANLATNCDSATQITGTAGTTGKVTFTPAGVRFSSGVRTAPTAPTVPAEPAPRVDRATSSSTIRPAAPMSRSRLAWLRERVEPQRSNWTGYAAKGLSGWPHPASRLLRPPWLTATARRSR